MAKPVVIYYKNRGYSLKIFQFSQKAPSSLCRRWDVMTQISVDTFDRESIALVVDIENMLARTGCFPLGRVAVCTILPGVRRMVYHALDRLNRFVSTYNMTGDLSRNANILFIHV